MPEPELEPELDEDDDDADAERDAEAAAALAAALSEQETETPLSQDDLDAMFAEPDPVESFVDEDENDSDDYDEIDDIPDPEPIPDVFTSPENEDEQESRFGAGLIISIAAAVIVAGLFAGLILAKDSIVGLMPGFASVYNLIGMGEPPPGKGLEIRATQTERNTEGGIDVAVVSGTVVNKMDHAVAVPYILVTLSDAEGVALQEIVVEPQQAEIGPSENFRFSTRIENPPPLARRVDITFTNPPMMSDNEGTATESGN